jgi:hypothetical protein
VDLCRRRPWSMTTTTRPLRKCSYKVISDEGGAGLLNDMGHLAGKSTTNGLFLTRVDFFLTRICCTENSIDNSPGLPLKNHKCSASALKRRNIVISIAVVADWWRMASKRVRWNPPVRLDIDCQATLASCAINSAWEGLSNG